MIRSQWLILAGLGTLLSCSSSSSTDPNYAQTGGSLAKQYLDRCKTSGKRVVELDLNRDKQPDVWKLYQAKNEGAEKVEILTCKETDLNFDGRKDMWVYFDDNGNRTMEEMDLDFDGKIDLVTFRKAGKVVRQELDTNYDGKPDIWKYFEDNVLARVDRDSNNDGKVDFWEYYEGGELDRVGYDKNGDGKVDNWDRAPSQPVPATKEVADKDKAKAAAPSEPKEAGEAKKDAEQ